MIKLLALALFSVVTFLPESTRAASSSKASKAPTLTDTMEDMNAAYRRLSRQIGNPARNADSLLLVARLKKATESSITFAPKRAEEFSGAEKADFVREYRKEMQLFLTEVDKLEEALRNDENALAVELLEKLKDLRNEGHKRYKRAEDV